MGCALCNVFSFIVIGKTAPFTYDVTVTLTGKDTFSLTALSEDLLYRSTDFPKELILLSKDDMKKRDLPSDEDCSFRGLNRIYKNSSKKELFERESVQALIDCIRTRYHIRERI